MKIFKKTVVQHEKNIKIGCIIFVVCFVGWEGYSKYQSVQLEKSSALLYAATTVDDADMKKAQFKELSEKYAGTGSGVWGQVELGHIAYNDKYYDEAITHYKSALNELASSSPLRPLVQLNLSQSYENMGDMAQAKTSYQALIEIAGFAGEGYLGLARLAEKEGDSGQALANYKEYVNLPETQAGQTKDWVDNKISQLSQ